MYDSKLLQRKMAKSKKNSRDNNKKYFIKLVNRILISFILVLAVLIMIKVKPEFKETVKEKVYQDNISFSKINAWYEKYLGGVLPFDLKLRNDDTLAVFSDKIEYQSIESYKDGAKLTVSKNYLVPAYESGIIVFIGEKEGYSKVVIVQQVNGVDLWYGNITNTSYKLYDYVEKGDLLGNTIDDKLYLVYQSNGEFLDYKKYLG